MKQIVIEVAPRTQAGEYHASCLDAWGCGKSIEEAVASVIATAHDKLQLTTNDLTYANKDFHPHIVRLRRLINLLSERGLTVEIRFIPLESR